MEIRSAHELLAGSSATQKTAEAAARHRRWKQKRVANLVTACGTCGKPPRLQKTDGTSRGFFLPPFPARSLRSRASAQGRESSVPANRFPTCENRTTLKPANLPASGARKTFHVLPNGCGVIGGARESMRPKTPMTPNGKVMGDRVVNLGLESAIGVHLVKLMMKCPVRPQSS